MITLSRGSTAKLNTNGGDHRCIVLNDPMKHRGRNSVLLVHMTSSSKDADSTCKINKGDDKLITKDCWVYYRRARIRTVSEVEKEVRKRNLTLRKISHAPYMRILSGALSNPAIRPHVRKALREAIRQGKAG